MAKQICIVDGQGGGVGSVLIRFIRAAYGGSPALIALGTNAVATANMIKAGADNGATGENAVCHTVARAEWLIGPVAVTWANALEGEVTPKMAAAIVSSPAVKVLLPLAQERIRIVGVLDAALPDLVRLLVEEELKALLGGGATERRRTSIFNKEPARHACL